MVLQEAYAYLDIRIYMGIHKKDAFFDYWKPPNLAWPGHSVREVMSLRRFQSIHKAFRLYTADPDHEIQAVFDRLEPLNTHIREVSRELWSPGRDVAIDKAMSRFQGRSLDTLKIPGKPIKQGYKIWVLAQMGYFYDWVFHRKGTKKDVSGQQQGPWKIVRPKALGKNTSSAVVAYLMDRLPDHGTGHIVYLDNLFTNIKLLQYGRKRGWGATGTYTAKSGILKKFSEMKAQDAKKDEIPWGKLWVAATPDNLINIMAWKDNALVLSMSTASDALKRVKKLRRRPSETSSAAKTARVPFGQHARAWLEIPEYEELYNYEMGAVDRGN